MLALFMVVYLLLHEALHLAFDSSSSSGGARRIVESSDNDNIGNVDMHHMLAYGPIDVVYTWVNGSDPKWLAKKAVWSAQKEEALRAAAAASAISANNSTNSNSTLPEAVGEEETMSQNRYRDSNELRYSLRSLIKNAPWIRRIYLVTDNQLPSWLNASHERIVLVSHEDVFVNKSHLPVFSSPAIESHLHRISGLSEHFIYFNDDVLLGSPTLPEDFVTVSGVQKFHLSWEVPKCSPGCSDSWIGDGFCDKACNVSSCNFDYPDCINGTLGVRVAAGGTVGRTSVFW